MLSKLIKGKKKRLLVCRKHGEIFQKWWNIWSQTHSTCWVSWIKKCKMLPVVSVKRRPQADCRHAPSQPINIHHLSSAGDVYRLFYIPATLKIVRTNSHSHHHGALCSAALYSQLSLSKMKKSVIETSPVCSDVPSRERKTERGQTTWGHSDRRKKLMQAHGGFDRRGVEQVITPEWWREHSRANLWTSHLLC